MLNLVKFAKLLVNYEVDVKNGDKVLIMGSSEAIPLIRETYREVLKAGGYPIKPIIQFPDQRYIFHAEGTDDVLSQADPLELYAIDVIDCLIMIEGQSNSKELANINQEKANSVRNARFQVMQKFYSRAAKGELRWTMTAYPTQSLAQESNMSQDELSSLISKTCFLELENPIQSWQELHTKHKKYINFLNQVDNLRFVAEGTDLTMSVKGRIWQNSAGKGNMPDGEIFTGPIEDSANGTIKFSYPLIDQGKKIEGIELTFKEGEVVQATATSRQDLLKGLLNNPGAKRIGEIAIGTNMEHQKFIGNILFDEKMAGTVHLAIGNGYPETGSTQQSTIHKDMLVEMRNGGKIFADGKLFYENGEFLI
jgi:aminopeptidase